MSDSTFMTIFTITGFLWPVYALVMMALSIWLFRQTHIEGSAELMTGFGGIFLAHMMIRLAQTSDMITLDAQTPSWFWAIQGFASLLIAVFNAVVAIGLFKLCKKLITDTRASHASIPSS